MPYIFFCTLLLHRLLPPLLPRKHLLAFPAFPWRIIRRCRSFLLKKPGTKLPSHSPFGISDRKISAFLMDVDQSSTSRPTSVTNGTLSEIFRKRFSQVDSVLDENMLLINEINQNQVSKIPANLSRNVPLIRQLNNNLTQVKEIYDDLSIAFIMSMRQQATSPNNQEIRTPYAEKISSRASCLSGRKRRIS